MIKERPTYETYRPWLKQEFGVTVDDRTKNHFDSLSRAIAYEWERSQFWTCLRDQLREWDGEYQVKTSYPLFVNPVLPTVDLKTFDSFLLKTFRKNVLLNGNWPDAPRDGWYLPHECFGRINDLLRTTLVVKYLDGVEFAADKLTSTATGCGWEAQLDMEAREEGYYAAHFYTFPEFRVPGPRFDLLSLRIPVEVQITTQLQDVIRRLTHTYYESRRKCQQPQERKWQWDYKSEEFAPNYLGHVLHYVEGMIMEIRDRDHKTR